MISDCSKTSPVPTDINHTYPYIDKCSACIKRVVLPSYGKTGFETHKLNIRFFLI